MAPRPWSPDEWCPSRRALLRGLAGVGVGTIAAGVLVACEAGDGGGATGAGGSEPPPPTARESPSTGSGSTSTGATSSTVVVRASEVPLGQARVVEVAGQRIVVAQPTEGSFVGFSTTCTHEGTPVNVLEGLELACPNHGSRFSAGDGSVTRGPATAPLAVVDVRLDGEDLVLG